MQNIQFLKKHLHRHKKLSTIRNEKMPKNQVIHEVIHVIHIFGEQNFEGIG